MDFKRIVLGSGYAAVGYALTRGQTLIIEESEQLDTQFCLPLRAYAFPESEASSALGSTFCELCRSLGIVRDGRTNTGALEIALARLALDGGITPLLKCRVSETSEHSVEVYTNEGFLTFSAEAVHDARRSEVVPSRLTVLFEDEGETAGKSLLSVFSGADVEPTFHEGSYAIHIPVDPTREPNALRAEIARRWEAAGTSAKIFHIAPTLSATLPDTRPSRPTLSDLDYASPLLALEGGVAFALDEIRREDKRK